VEDAFHGLTLGCGRAATGMDVEDRRLGLRAGPPCPNASDRRCKRARTLRAVADDREDDVTGQPVPRRLDHRLDRHHRFPLAGFWLPPTLVTFPLTPTGLPS
jgi:hypothetical protein